MRVLIRFEHFRTTEPLQQTYLINPQLDCSGELSRHRQIRVSDPKGPSWKPGHTYIRVV